MAKYFIASIQRDGFRLFLESWTGMWHYDINLALRFEYQGIAEDRAQSLSRDNMVASTYVLENDGHKVLAMFEKGQQAPFRDNLHWEELL